MFAPYHLTAKVGTTVQAQCPTPHRRGIELVMWKEMLRESCNCLACTHRKCKDPSCFHLLQTLPCCTCVYDVTKQHVREAAQVDISCWQLGNKPVPTCREQIIDVWRGHTDHQQRGTSSIYCFRYTVIAYSFILWNFEFVWQWGQSTSCTFFYKTYGAVAGIFV